MKSLLLQVVRYITNTVVANLPSYTLRHIWYRHVLQIELGKQSAIFMNVHFHILGRPKPNRPVIKIGDHTIVNRQCVLDGRGGLRVGNNVSISPGVWILTDAHDMQDPFFPEIFGPVTIGDYAWLGSRAMVLPGVTVGEGAVIAAGAIATKHVPPYTVVAGIPARPIGVRQRDLRYKLTYKPILE